MWDIFPFFLTTRQNVNTTTYQRNNVTTRQYATVSVSRHVKMPKTVRPFTLHFSYLYSIKKYIFDSQQMHEEFKMYLHSFTHKSQVLQGRHITLVPIGMS